MLPTLYSFSNVHYIVCNEIQEKSPVSHEVLKLCDSAIYTWNFPIFHLETISQKPLCDLAMVLLTESGTLNELKINKGTGLIFQVFKIIGAPLLANKIIGASK